MRIVSKSRLREFWSVHRTAESLLQTWHGIVDGATWRQFADVKRTFNSADLAGDFVIFNVNSYRIVAGIAYTTGCVYIKHVFTHSEYDTWNKNRR